MYIYMSMFIGFAVVAGFLLKYMMQRNVTVEFIKNDRYGDPKRIRQWRLDIYGRTKRRLITSIIGLCAMTALAGILLKHPLVMFILILWGLYVFLSLAFLVLFFKDRGY